MVNTHIIVFHVVHSISARSSQLSTPSLAISRRLDSRDQYMFVGVVVYQRVLQAMRKRERCLWEDVAQEHNACKGNSKEHCKTLLFGPPWQVLGQGQFGTTRLVTELESGDQYACKSISKKKLKRRDEVEDVKREVQVRVRPGSAKNGSKAVRMWAGTGAARGEVLGEGSVG